MSYLVHQIKYIEMMVNFLDRKLEAAGFVKKFLRLWKRDRNAQWKVKEGWNEPFDEQLQAAFLRGEIDERQFSERWNELWGYRTEREVRFVEMLDRIFSACDLFTDDPRPDAHPGLEYDEDGLRSFVARELGSYIQAISQSVDRRAVG